MNSFLLAVLESKQSSALYCSGNLQFLLVKSHKYLAVTVKRIAPVFVFGHLSMSYPDYCILLRPDSNMQ